MTFDHIGDLVPLSEMPHRSISGGQHPKEESDGDLQGFLAIWLIYDPHTIVKEFDQIDL